MANACDRDSSGHLINIQVLENPSLEYEHFMIKRKVATVSVFALVLFWLREIWKLLLSPWAS